MPCKNFSVFNPKKFRSLFLIIGKLYPKIFLIYYHSYLLLYFLLKLTPFINPMINVTPKPNFINWGGRIFNRLIAQSEKSKFPNKSGLFSLFFFLKDAFIFPCQVNNGIYEKEIIENKGLQYYWIQKIQSIDKYHIKKPSLKKKFTFDHCFGLQRLENRWIKISKCFKKVKIDNIKWKRVRLISLRKHSKKTSPKFWEKFRRNEFFQKTLSKADIIETIRINLGNELKLLLLLRIKKINQIFYDLFFFDKIFAFDISSNNDFQLFKKIFILIEIIINQPNVVNKYRHFFTNLIIDEKIIWSFRYRCPTFVEKIFSIGSKKKLKSIIDHLKFLKKTGMVDLMRRIMVKILLLSNKKVQNKTIHFWFGLETSFSKRIKPFIMLKYFYSNAGSSGKTKLKGYQLNNPFNYIEIFKAASSKY
mmetsp:Transcript_4882/g.7844  ORF Transcript_4882/g.7844 Transcript_4882/m.7844 type:complete len:418 (+) Transcript_4882:83-1336(+)